MLVFLLKKPGFGHAVETSAADGDLTMCSKQNCAQSAPPKPPASVPGLPMEMSTCIYEDVNMVLYGSLYQSRTGNNLDAHQNRIVAYCTAINIQDQTIQNPVRDVSLSERNQS